jgi:hypothetical protein
VAPSPDDAASPKLSMLKSSATNYSIFNIGCVILINSLQKVKIFLYKGTTQDESPKQDEYPLQYEEALQE